MATTKKKSTGDVESIQDEQLSRTLLKRFDEAKKARENFDSLWDKCNNFYNSNQWQDIESVAGYQSEPQYNKIFEFVETMRGYLSDNAWGVNVVPSRVPPKIAKQVRKADANDDPTMDADDKSQDAKKQILVQADKVNQLLEFMWHDTRMSRKLAMVLQDSFITGTGFLKTVFDPDNVSQFGIGQVETRPVSPYYIFPDPEATDIDDCEFLIEKHPVSIRWVLENYPDRAKEFMESVSESSMDAAPQGTKTTGPVTPDEGTRVDVLECWFKDSTIQQEFDEENETTTSSPKYPNGRYVVMSDKGVILEDKASDYNRFPYTIFREIVVPNQFWGGCSIEKVLPMQQDINTILRSIIDNGVWMAHGIWIVDRSSGVSPAQLQGFGPRDVIMKNPAGEVRRDCGTPLPPHLFETLQNLLKGMDTMLGFPDVLRGIVPSRQPVQTTMIQQESGEVRTRERARRVEEALVEWGTQVLDIITENWVDTRMVHNQGVVGFDIFELSKEDLEGWRFKVFVRPGSTTPRSAGEMLQRALELRNQGIEIPGDYIAGISGLPGIEAAMLRAQRDAMALMQQQALPAGDGTPAIAGDEDGMVNMDLPPEEQAEPSQEALAEAEQIINQEAPPIPGEQPIA